SRRRVRRRGRRTRRDRGRRNNDRRQSNGRHCGRRHLCRCWCGDHGWRIVGGQVGGHICRRLAGRAGRVITANGVRGRPVGGLVAECSKRGGDGGKGVGGVVGIGGRVVGDLLVGDLGVRDLPVGSLAVGGLAVRCVGRRRVASLHFLVRAISASGALVAA